jgi:hypothetical protein
MTKNTGSSRAWLSLAHETIPLALDIIMYEPSVVVTASHPIA